MEQMETSGSKLDALDRKLAAAKAGCDARTLASYLDGGNVRPMVRARIERALREMGFEGAVRAGAAS